MADRFPLIVNPISQKIEEIVAGDNLDLTGNNIVVAGDTGAGKYLTSDGSTVSWGTPGNVYLTASQTLTNKILETCSISGVLNTLVDIPNSALTNPRITINGTQVPLGGSITTANDNTTYSISAVDGTTAIQKIIRLTSAGTGAGVTDDIILEQGSNVTLTRVGDTITIASSFTDTNTVTSLRGTTSGTYVTGQVTIAGGGDTTVSQSGNTITISTSDQDTITRIKGGISGTLVTGDVNILQGGATTVSQNGNDITISSQDTITTVQSSGVTGVATSGAITIAASGAASVSQSGSTITVSATDTNTVTRIRATETGTYNSGDITFIGSGASSVSQNGTVITVTSVDTNTTYQAADGLNLNGTSFEIKNSANLLQNRLSKWDDTNAQFTNSIISDDGSTVTVAGNLTVTGTANKVTFETQTLVVADDQIELRRGNSLVGANGGVQVNRTTDATGNVLTYSAMQWFETGGYWRVFNGTNAFRLVTETETQTLTNKTLTSPVMTTPSLGAASATTINKVTITEPANGSTLTIADGKTLTCNRTLTLSGTDGSTIGFGGGGTVVYRADKLSALATTSSTELRGVISDETGIGALVFAQSPTFVTSIITSSTSFDIINTSATTVNAFGAATSIAIGSNSSGTTVIRHGLTVNASAILGSTASDTITANGVFSSPNTDIYIRGSRVGLGLNDLGSNLFFGVNSGNNINTGSQNTSFGFESLYLDSDGENNSAFGYNALRNNTIGSNNTAVGRRSSRSNVNGNRNVSIGTGSLETNQIGNDNVCVGYFAGYGLTGSGNVLIGSASSGSSTSPTYQPLSASGNNQLVIGSGTNYWLRGDSSYNLTVSNDLNVTSNLNVGGNLTVEGQLVTFNVNTLTVDDKDIELASVQVVLGRGGDISGLTVINTTTDNLYAGQQLTKSGGTGEFGTGAYIVSVDSSTQFTFGITGGSPLDGTITYDVGGANDDTADGAGITIPGTTTKTFKWIKSTGSFTSSENINIASGKTLRVANVQVISGSQIGPSTGSFILGAGVLSSSLTSVGTLTSLKVTGDLVVNGPSNPADYTLSDGIFVQPANGLSGLTITSGSATNNAYINFSAGTASNAEQFAFAIGRDGTNSQGMVKINDVDVARFGSNGIIMPSGKGIDFSANANAAGMTSELLDDYEEGTWTPIARGRTTTGSGTYTRQSGYYTKIGNTVTAWFDIGWSGHTGGGGLEISLPFTVNSTLNYPSGGFVSYNSGLSYTAGYSVYGWSDIGGSYVRIWQSNDTGASLAVPMDTSVGEFHMVITYLVD